MVKSFMMCFMISNLQACDRAHCLRGAIRVEDVIRKALVKNLISPWHNF